MDPDLTNTQFVHRKLVVGEELSQSSNFLGGLVFFIGNTAGPISGVIDNLVTYTTLASFKQ